VNDEAVEFNGLLVFATLSAGGGGHVDKPATNERRRQYGLGFAGERSIAVTRLVSAVSRAARNGRPS
jgi:hypothetical protein